MALYKVGCMDIEKSAFNETLELIEQRVTFFSTHHLSAENILTVPNNAFSVRSLSEIVPQLASYGLDETPLHMNLADIYLGRDAIKNQFKNCSVKFVLPPVSEGEDSITEDNTFEPSFKWISNAIIDSSYLITDKIEPKKVERGKVSPEWKGILELLLCNVDRNIYYKREMLEFEETMKSRFEKFPWIKLKKIREVYYKGKPSILLRFGDDLSSEFVYFNLSTATQKDLLGQQCEVFRVTENKLKEKLATEVALVFRKLPANTTKESFLAIFKKTPPVWMEDLIEICGFKYTICKVNYLDEAFSIVTAFNAKNIK
jgi:hypothetical protein